MGMIKHRSDTVGVENTIKDKYDALLDPDSHSIQVYDPDNTAMLGTPETNPTKISVGVYEYYYNIPSDAKYGDWLIQWKAVRRTYSETEDFRFTVEKKAGD